MLLLIGEEDESMAFSTADMELDVVPTTEVQLGVRIVFTSCYINCTADTCTWRPEDVREMILSKYTN